MIILALPLVAGTILTRAWQQYKGGELTGVTPCTSDYMLLVVQVGSYKQCQTVPFGKVSKYVTYNLDKTISKRPLTITI